MPCCQLAPRAAITLCHDAAAAAAIAIDADLIFTITLPPPLILMLPPLATADDFSLLDYFSLH